MSKPTNRIYAYLNTHLRTHDPQSYTFSATITQIDVHRSGSILIIIGHRGALVKPLENTLGGFQYIS